jgi:hypothetical protein
MSEIVICKSVWKGIRLILLGSLFVIPSILILLKGAKEDRLICWLAICLFGLVYPVGLSIIIDRRPQIIINETGIFVRNLSDKVINWEIMRKAYIAEINKQAFICLVVDEEYELMHSKGRLYRSVVKINKELGFQELNIWLNNVNVNKEKLLALIQQAIHATPEERKALLGSGKV